MGTHNQLLSVRSESHRQAYLELIALDPQAHGVPAPGQSRWFDLDDAGLHADVAAHGPKLIHVVAGVRDIDAAGQRLAALGIDRGPALLASRQTPRGLLQWRITVRPDGQRLLDGTLPTLIEWTPPEAQPALHLPGSPVRLLAVQAWHPEAELLAQAWHSLSDGAAETATLEATLEATHDATHDATQATQATQATTRATTQKLPNAPAATETSAPWSVHLGAPRLLAFFDTPLGRVVLDSARSAKPETSLG
jgi:hypothetical protein